MHKSVFWRNKNNDRSLLLVSRSASTSLFSAICEDANISTVNKTKHPSCYCGCWSLNEGYWNGSKHVKPSSLAVVVRNPLERFISACIRTGKSIDEALTLTEKDVHFWPIHYMNPTNPKYFLFPEEISHCATWLGIKSNIKKLNSNNGNKELRLTSIQRNKFEDIYKEDIILWKSLV